MRGSECGFKVLFLDLDGTVWDHHDISSLTPPFRRLSRDAIVSKEGVVVRLFPGVREFLEAVKRLGVKVVALSWNVYEKAREALDALELTEYFDALYIEPHPHEGLVMKRALDELGGVDPAEVVYVDDRDIHLDEVRRVVGQVTFIMAWRDFKSYGEAVELLERLCKE